METQFLGKVVRTPESNGIRTREALSLSLTNTPRRSPNFSVISAVQCNGHRLGSKL